MPDPPLSSQIERVQDALAGENVGQHEGVAFDVAVLNAAWEEMHREAAQVVEWLQQSGFPYDWQSTIPAPRWLLHRLAKAWAKAEGEPGAKEWAESMQAEQEFADA